MRSLESLTDLDDIMLEGQRAFEMKTASIISNPYLSAEHTPAKLGIGILEWRKRYDAWELGYRVARFREATKHDAQTMLKMLEKMA